jgi:hypothetical protein
MKDLCASFDSALMGRVDVANTERNLRAVRRRSVLALVQREVDERTVGPRGRGVSAACPGVVPMMIPDVEIEAETVAVELYGAVEIRHCEHDGHETFGVVNHKRILPDLAPARRVPIGCDFRVSTQHLVECL